VSLPHATFALVIRDGIVVDAPPISRHSIGRPALAVLDYYRRRGALVRSLPDPEVSPMATPKYGPTPAPMPAGMDHVMPGATATPATKHKPVTMPHPMTGKK
jgi:hypothetical protein